MNQVQVNSIYVLRLSLAETQKHKNTKTAHLRLWDNPKLHANDARKMDGNTINHYFM